MDDRTEWHALPLEQSLRLLTTDADGGLPASEVERRRAVHGPNRLHHASRRHPVLLLLQQFKDFMSLVLMAGAVLSGLIGDAADTITILVIIVLNAGVGFFQAYRADRALDALRNLASPTSTVRRDGRDQVVPAAELVPGDVVMLEAGALVPADLRLIESAGLHNDESTLTGESQPVEKHVRALPAEHVLADRRNMAYQGTLALSGRARGLVVATGMKTELGRIATLLSQQDEVKTPLQRRLDQFGRRLSVIVIAIAAIVFLAGLLRGEAALPLLLIALSLAVAAIPEALPAVVTIALSLGATRMARKRALVRQLPAVETLGSVTCICSDKTGTLTLNRMSAQAVYCAGGEHAALPMTQAAAEALARALALNSDVVVASDGLTLLGDPTEIALIELVRATTLDLPALSGRWPRVAELPFDSQRKRMLTLHRDDNGNGLAILKGAPEVVLPLCTRGIDQGFDPQALMAVADALAARGCRVLAFAQKPVDAPAAANLAALEERMQFLGFVGLIDPPRPEAADAIEVARVAGIETIMITGDHPLTAVAIARAVGIDTRNGVMTGSQLQALGDDELIARVSSARVYARVSPEQKIRIVRALRRAGEIVAVTGDGVNDAPALKNADVGIAMGGKGTDVAREAADLVLLDDNFATIVSAMREGRRIYDNIRKFVKYAVTTNTGEVLLLLLAPFLGLPMPLLPIQILWINLVSDGLPGLALATDAGAPDLMRRPPRPPRESLFARGLGYHVVWVGLLIAGLVILLQSWAIERGNTHWQTLVLCALTFAQIGQLLAIRNERGSAFGRGQPRNRPLLAAIAFSVIAQLAVVYLPIGNRIFHTQPLGRIELALCIACAVLVFVAVEFEKLLVRRGLLYRNRAMPGV